MRPSAFMDHIFKQCMYFYFSIFIGQIPLHCKVLTIFNSPTYVIVANGTTLLHKDLGKDSPRA